MICIAATERRLAEQQVENEAERVRLQALISRMESSLSDQTRQLEQVWLIRCHQIIRNQSMCRHISDFIV